MTTYLINGTNRGIGLALCQLLTQQHHKVIALCRTASPDLSNTNAQIIPNIDITSDSLERDLNTALPDNCTIDVVINMAGIWHNESIGAFNTETIEAQFNVNALGPMRLSLALLSRLSPAGKIAFISSRMGSMTDNTSGGRYGYRMSKAALNAAAKSLSEDLKPQKIAVAIIHPGLVATDMTQHNGISPKEAAAQIIERLAALNINNSGQFWHANGEELPW